MSDATPARPRPGDAVPPAAGTGAPESSADTPAAAPSQATPPEGPGSGERSLEALLAEAQAKIEAQREALMRALADADNARKRAQAEITAAHKFALERFAETLLPVVDSLEAALAAENADAQTQRSGIELTLRQLQAALEKASVTEVAPAAGERFDPNHHQAMASVEAEAEPNSVVSLMQKGWRLHERVLRPALVTVAKPRPANDA